MPAINIRLTDAELERLHELADAEGRSMNNYVRRQLFASSPTPLRTRIERRRVAKDTLIGTDQAGDPTLGPIAWSTGD